MFADVRQACVVGTDSVGVSREDVSEEVGARKRRSVLVPCCRGLDGEGTEEASEKVPENADGVNRLTRVRRIIQVKQELKRLLLAGPVRGELVEDKLVVFAEELLDVQVTNRDRDVFANEIYAGMCMGVDIQEIATRLVDDVNARR